MVSEARRKLNQIYLESVLILVLVEDGLRALSLMVMRKGTRIVLILVLVEDGLRDQKNFCAVSKALGLNPCSCGGWSQRL